jgi:hypothetical protein
MLAPSQKVCATIKQVVDERGVIHIFNIGKNKTNSSNANYNDPIQSQDIEVVNLKESTPSNIFPEPEEANTLASNPDFPAPALEQ